jgi:hypothetical protein
MQFMILGLILGAALYLANAAVASLGPSVPGPSIWWLSVAPIMLMHAGSGYCAIGGANFYKRNCRRAALACLAASAVITLATTALAAVAALRFPLSLSPMMAIFMLLISQATAVGSSAFVIHLSRRPALGKGKT